MGIYVLYDKFEQPVQIGQSRTIFKRLRQHRRDHLRNRWSLFSWFGFYKVGVNNELLVRDQAAQLRRTLTLEESLSELEAILIQVLEPRLNRRGPNWVDTEEYLQQIANLEEENEDEEDVK
jgi:excinuclease UvrABC nuclease subunit